MSGADDKPVAGIKDHASRRVHQLAEENRQLRQYVAEVMDRLRENERLFARLFDLESKVLASSDPEDLCFALLRGLRSNFELDMVRFWFSRSSFIGGRQMDGVSERDLVWLEKCEIERMGLNQKHVWLMQLSDDKGFDWLEGRDHHLASMALLVLGDLQRPFGVLGLGSVDGERFQPGKSADFLQHLAQVVGLSLENAVSRERLARLAITDSLTGSHNRRFLQPHSHQPLSKWFGQGVDVCCLYIDVDDFKSLNDRFGHEAGDDVLSKLASTIAGIARAQDPLIRMGGDEFALLLPGCPLDKAQTIVGKLIEQCNAILTHDQRISVSAGLAFASAADDKRVKELIGDADQAMYVAKALGGGRFELAGRSG
ncbi:MAG: sensory box protein [Zetaproteobacteria bacterium CG2_30_59_37]|nr:MAG: sensory box protein [Zetaproteobacteria bacterium CG2_30_59_37]